MLRITLRIVLAVFLLGIAALALHFGTRYFWERRVWQCYSSFGPPDQVPKRLMLPPACRADAIVVSDLGRNSASVVLYFSPPKTMWLDYVLGTSDYDSYSIEISPKGPGHRVRLHHGSD